MRDRHTDDRLILYSGWADKESSPLTRWIGVVLGRWEVRLYGQRLG